MYSKDDKYSTDNEDELLEDELNLGNSSMDAEQLKKLKKLKKLNLNFNRIGDQGAKAIAESPRLAHMYFVSIHYN